MKLGKNVTEEQIRDLLNLKFDSVSNLTKMDDNFSTTVWKFSDSSKNYYLRYHDDPIAYEGDKKLAELFEPEVWALEKSLKAGVRVPRVSDWNDSCTKLPVPYVILEEIKGKAIGKVKKLLSKKQIDLIIHEAGRDIAKVNSIPVKKFGYCNDGQTIKNGVLTGNDEKWTEYVSHAEYESLVLFQKRKHLDEATAKKTRMVFQQGIKDFAIEQGYLTHGDFDPSHVFQEKGNYTGIIDFGDKKSADPVYDLAHFNMYYPEYLGPLKSGWIEYVRENQLHPNIELDDIDRRIAFYTILVSLNKGGWVIRNIKDRDPMVYVNPIEPTPSA